MSNSLNVWAHKRSKKNALLSKKRNVKIQAKPSKYMPQNCNFTGLHKTDRFYCKVFFRLSYKRLLLSRFSYHKMKEALHLQAKAFLILLFRIYEIKNILCWFVKQTIFFQFPSANSLTCFYNKPFEMHATCKTVCSWYKINTFTQEMIHHWKMVEKM